MRTSLLPGLVEALRRNRNRQQERVRLFEIGSCSSTRRARRMRSPRVAGGRLRPRRAEQWAGADARAVDFFDLKGDVEWMLAWASPHERRAGHATDAAVAASRPQRAEFCAETAGSACLGACIRRLLKALDLAHDVHVFELDLERDPRAAYSRAPAAFRASPRSAAISPSTCRKRCLTRVEAVVRDAVGENLTDFVLFDRYAGGNLGTNIKSLAIGLILQDVHALLRTRTRTAA